MRFMLKIRGYIIQSQMRNLRLQNQLMLVIFWGTKP